MIRLSKKTKERLRRRQQSVLKQYVKVGREIAAQKYRARKKKRKNVKSNYLPALWYRAPEIVTIDHADHRAALLNFLSKLRAHYRHRPDRTIGIDFSSTTQFVAGGTLLLYAELCRLISYSNNSVKLRCKEPVNNRASQVLKQIGIYRLCANKCSVKPSREDVVHWQVIQGQLVDNSLCAPTIEGFQDRIDAAMIDELLGGLGEAMTNAIHHAYDDTRQDGLGYNGNTDWWMFSQEKDGFLSVVFCDLGIGIPITLPVKRPGIWEKLVLRVPSPTDADCIREAIIEGRTRTGLDGRGYGLGNIVDVVENIPTGFVNVYSNRGVYSSRKDNPYPNDYADSILGTMIQWRVPMKALPNANVT